MLMPGPWSGYSRSNATWRQQFALQDKAGAPIDLTDWTAKLTVRTDDGQILTTIATGGQGITIDAVGGTITCVIAQEVVATWPAGTHVYDLLATDAIVERHVYIAGSWTHELGVTLP